MTARNLRLRRGLWLVPMLVAIHFNLGIGFWSFAQAQGRPHQVLAFYYGWYGSPAVSGGWRHWKDVDPAGKRIADSTHFPAFDAYDSHDPAILDRQAALAHNACISGFIASWWGQGSFEDKGMPLLLAAAGRHGLTVSAYYEKIDGNDAAARARAAAADLDYLLRRYGADKAWLKADGKPVIFVYGRALKELPAAEWREVLARVRRNHPGGAVFIADTRNADLAAVFDGTSSYNITGQTQRKTPDEARRWARAAFANWVKGTPAGKISTVTVIPGYDDRAVNRKPPRPVTNRWDGEIYRALWREAIAAGPDWVLITSWNEWHEGSEIEPSVEYGSLFLNETTAFACGFVRRTRP